MEINDTILKNEELLKQMKLYKSEIERLSKIRDLLRVRPTPDSPYNFIVAGRLSGMINRAKKHFEMLNQAYDEQTHKEARKFTAALIAELNEGLQKVEKTILTLKF